MLIAELYNQLKFPVKVSQKEKLKPTQSSYSRTSYDIL